MVKRGEEILVLDTASSSLALEQLEEKLSQKANEQHQRELETRKELDSLQSRIEQKKLDAEILGYRAEQNRTLNRQGLASEEAARAAEVEAKKATIELEQLRREVEATRKTAGSQLEGISMALRILRRERDEARRQLELARARVDRDGVLTWVTPEVGAMVRTGDVIARIADLDSFRIEATTSDIHASKLAEGMPVRVRVGRRPNRRSDLIDRSHDRKGVVRFDVALDHPDDSRIRNNLRVDVEVIAGASPAMSSAYRGPISMGGKQQEMFVVRGMWR